MEAAVQGRRRLAEQTLGTDRHGESLALWDEELRSADDGVQWISDAIVRAMEARDLTIAGDLAALLAAFQYGELPVEQLLSVGKLQHDAEQFRYLRERGLLGEEFDRVAADYLEIAERVAPIGIDERRPMEPDEEHRIGHVYNRIVHVHRAPRVGRALSDAWDPAAMEHQYLHVPPGAIVIDDFLSPEALEGVRRFCLESTIWNRNRYASSRLGSLFFGGFNCPLLLQIAEEVRDAFPRAIGSRHPLRQLWGFKNAPSLPGDSTVHADFAAVNVNLWITPEEANTDESSGGLVVYDATAPLDWDFRTYNESTNLIKGYLRERGARAVTIPYRANRAIIFNSDLFHATAAVRFKPGYANRRINITMLYGERRLDDNHPAPVQAASAGSAWNSSAFRRR
ncbi:MAG: phytanoyl-CoA dioxygenase family protein [Actinomycetota bacterium]|nr:phytanoyl-CoA dioxygenase family protein [Actinomycetota bacterium]